jgi:alanine dehydrogenase
MPGAVPWASTRALTNATLPYCLAMADKGLEAAALEDRALYRGINIFDGRLVSQRVAESQERVWHELHL